MKKVFNLMKLPYFIYFFIFVFVFRTFAVFFHEHLFLYFIVGFQIRAAMLTVCLISKLLLNDVLYISVKMMTKLASG